jgi:hypothetical protein
VANLDEHFQAIVAESGPDSLMELWNYLGHVYTAQSVSQALSELNEYAAEENAIFGSANDLPEDEMGIVGSSVKHVEKAEMLAALRANKKAKARASGLRIVPVRVTAD